MLPDLKIQIRLITINLAVGSNQLAVGHSTKGSGLVWGLPSFAFLINWSIFQIFMLKAQFSA